VVKEKNGSKTGKAAAGWILVGVDFSPPARQALIRARSLARERDVPLLVLHVIDVPGLDEIAQLAGIDAGDLRERLVAERRRRLSGELLDLNEGGGGANLEPALAWGRPFEQILRKASEHSVELIVLGTSGRSADLERALFGSTAEKVLRAAPCPVLCVPAEP
jgi:nucleotide-binding universal stress UspA family protein